MLRDCSATPRKKFSEFGSDLVDAGGIYAEALSCGQGLAGQFEQDAFEDGDYRH